MGLEDDELAFYDALSENESAVDVMGDETLSFLARELVRTVRNNVTIDWTIADGFGARRRCCLRDGRWFRLWLIGCVW